MISSEIPNQMVEVANVMISGGGPKYPKKNPLNRERKGARQNPISVTVIIEKTESFINDAITTVTSEIPAPNERSTAPTRMTVACARLTRMSGVNVMKFIRKTWNEKNPGWMIAFTTTSRTSIRKLGKEESCRMPWRARWFFMVRSPHGYPRTSHLNARYSERKPPAFLR